MQMLTRSLDERISLDNVLNSEWIGKPDPSVGKPMEDCAEQVKSQFVSFFA